MVAADVSFISLTVLMSVLVGCADPNGGALLLLVKPQFEVDRVAASKGRGVVRSDQLRRSALDRVAQALLKSAVPISAVVASPLLGPAGNAEFFLYGQRSLSSPATRAGSQTLDGHVSAMIDAALDAAPDRGGEAR